MGIRILIVDDHPSFRSWARAMLAAEGFDVVGEAANGAEAVARARDLNPDVVLLDVQLPDMDGFDVARSIRADGGDSNGTKVVLTSTRDAAEYAADLAAADAPFVAKVDLTGPAIMAAIGSKG